MDVRCTKCGIEYEFDDAKVTAAGVTVKCTNCGHVFKVKREPSSDPNAGIASLPPAPSSSSSGSFSSSPFATPQSTFAKGMDGGEWMVKRTDGQVFRFKELTTLQKWIVERKVGRDDEISKTGKTWKKLGEIAELASFFQVVDAANAALQASLAPSPTSPAMPLPHLAQGLVVMPTTNPGAPAAPASTASLPPGPIAVGVGERVPDPRLPEPTAPAVPVKQSPTEAKEDSLAGLDDDDPVVQMLKRRRRNAALAVVGVILVAAGASAAVFWPQVSAALGVATVAANDPAVDRAEKAVRDDKLDDLRAARTALDAASTSRALAWRARLDVAIASHEKEQARIHDAIAARLDAAKQPAGDHAAQAKSLRDDANAMLGAAYATITQVRTDAPRLVDGHLAAAAYQLARGGLQEQRADLESARAHAKSAGDPAAVDAEIAAQQALADADAGLGADAAAALARIPATSADKRLQYARAALAVAALEKKPATAADIEAARAVVEGLAGDERAALLRLLLDAMAPPPPAVVDAGPVASADAGPAATTTSAAHEPDATEEPNAIGAASYDVIMQKAERARVNDRSRVAYELFGKAAKLKPGAPRPWLGLGWAALDLGKNGEAIRAFQKALELDESNSDAQFGLAEAYNVSGKKPQALEAYKTYLKMDPNGKDAAVAKRAIDAIE
jgi:predicted Zn finger-like uncharacterized protein